MLKTRESLFSSVAPARDGDWLGAGVADHWTGCRPTTREASAQRPSQGTDTPLVHTRPRLKSIYRENFPLDRRVRQRRPSSANDSKPSAPVEARLSYNSGGDTEKLETRPGTALSVSRVPLRSYSSHACLMGCWQPREAITQSTVLVFSWILEPAPRISSPVQSSPHRQRFGSARWECASLTIRI